MNLDDAPRATADTGTVSHRRRRFLVGAGVAVFDEARQLLLVQRSEDGTWGLPGGHIEFGESFADCARRECAEETGWSVELDALMGVYSEPEISLVDVGEEVVQYLGVFFYGRLVEPVGVPDAEISNVGWFGSTAHPILWAPDAPIVHDAFAAPRGPIVR